MQLVYLINTNTGVIFPRTANMDVRPHIIPYEPTKAEIKLGRQITSPARVIDAHEEAPLAAAEEVVAETVDSDNETEVDISGDEAVETAMRTSPEAGTDGGDADAAAGAPERKPALAFPKDGMSPAKKPAAEKSLSPQQKAAITRARNTAAKKNKAASKK